MMTSSLRKLALATHITFSVGWFGAVAGFLALAIAGLASNDSMTSLLSGVIQSLGTPWGLFQHYWVVVKLLLTIVATAFLLVHMQPVGFIADMVSQHSISNSEFGGLRKQLVVDAGAALLVLLAAIVLSVYKPWGRTSYGRMKLEQNSLVKVKQLVTRRAWERYFWIALVSTILLFIILHLAGGGMAH